MTKKKHWNFSFFKVSFITNSHEYVQAFWVLQGLVWFDWFGWQFFCGGGYFKMFKFLTGVKEMCWSLGHYSAATHQPSCVLGIVLFCFFTSRTITVSRHEKSWVSTLPASLLCLKPVLFCFRILENPRLTQSYGKHGCSCLEAGSYQAKCSVVQISTCQHSKSNSRYIKPGKMPNEKKKWCLKRQSLTK